MIWDEKFSVAACSVEQSEIRELLKLLSDPDVISFAGGIPDPELFPVDATKMLLNGRETEDAHFREIMQYSQSEGYAPLRDWIAEAVSTSQLAVRRDNVLITNGAQQSLSLLAEALIDPGDAVAVADPSYLGALQIFKGKQARFVTVETDDKGLCLDALEKAFRTGVKFLYTMPDFQNPGGVSIPADRRRQIVELAHVYRVPVIEDTAYRALYYDKAPPASLLEVEGKFLGPSQWRDTGLVIQVGTFSKTLMPALRVGWTIAPNALLKKLVQLKQARDLHSSTFNQAIACGLAKGVLKDHEGLLRRTYRARRDAMVEALTRYLPNCASFTPPGGGMFVWITLPEGMDARKLLETALRREKLAFVPGNAFHANGGGENTMRLSFVTYGPEAIRDGVRRLSALIAQEHLSRGDE